MKFLSSFLVLAALSSLTRADVADPAFYEISEVKIQELKIHPEDLLIKNQDQIIYPAQDKKLLNGGDIGKVIAVAKELVALGEDVYKLLNQGRPVVQTETAPISVLPKDSKGQVIEPFELEEWAMPKSKKFRITYKNGFGMEVVRFDYMVISTYGGKLEGRGAYLTGVQMIPSNVYVMYGFDLNAQMKVQSIANHGSKASPVAGVVLVMSYRVSNMLNTSEVNDTVLLTGNGVIQKY